MKISHGRLVGNLIVAAALAAATFAARAQTFSEAGSGDVFEALPITLHRMTVEKTPAFEMQWNRSRARGMAGERIRIQVNERDCQRGYGQLGLIKLGGAVTLPADWARNGPAALDRMAAETCVAGLAMKAQRSDAPASSQ